MADETITIIVKATDQASKVLDNIKTSSSGLGSALGSVGKIAGGFLAGGAIERGLGSLVGAFQSTTAEARESIEVNAQLDAVLKSTGGAAGVTATEARKLASELQKTSKFEDEAVLGGENLLLTFTNIGKDVFPRATQTMVDMSQALGQDMKSSAIQLGKALNDPIQGMTALRRVGVSFTDAQVEQIRVMQESGDLMGAQALILAELEKEFGGSAKAASDAAGQQEVMKDRMSELREEIGTKLLPVQEKLAEVQLKLVDILVSEVLPAIEEVVAFVKDNWTTIGPIFQFVYEYVKTRIEGMIQVIKSVVEIVKTVVDLVDAIIKGDWSRAWNDLKKIAEEALKLLIGLVRSYFGQIPEVILDTIVKAVSAAVDLGKKVVEGIVEGLRDLFRSVDEKLGGVPSAIIGFYQQAWEAAFGLAGRILDGIRDGLSGIAGFVSELLGPALGIINDFLRLVGLAKSEASGAAGVKGLTVQPWLVQDPLDGMVSPQELALREELRRTPGSPFYIPGYQMGMPYVPADMLAFLHRGERVVSADQNRQGAWSEGVTVNFNGPSYFGGNDAQASAEAAGWSIVAAARSRGLVTA